MPAPKSTNRKKVVILLIGLILVGAGTFLYLHNNHKNKQNLVNTKQGKTVTGTTSSPSSHNPSDATNSSQGQSGGVTDKNGQVSGSLPDPSLWVASNSGKLTLQQPSHNTIVKSGDTISGISKTDSDVQFVLTDDSVGQIAQGSLKVVNGKFSGLLQFTPHSKSGRLEVFHPNPDNGAEEDVVEINVNY
jgi:hypothetical protein